MSGEDRLVSVVLPVYNEALNIEPCLRRLAAALRQIRHEILVCYDRDEDATLPAIARMPDPPASVRLVKNDLGPGAAFALRAGFRAARGDVIVTTMADLSDPPELIPLMAERIRNEGADVVSGSRYVKGGRQEGGPPLKVFLSRMAGLTLRRVAGLGTHDATTNFRAYSRVFLDQVRIESEKGFEVALELTVKAHLGGFKVAEIPSTWIDRTHGESRFRLLKWLPHYLRWYAAAMAAPVLVGAIWATLGLGLLYFIHAWGLEIPFYDEWEMVPFVTRDRPVTPEWLWAQHNEQRIPLTKLLFLVSVWGGGDRFRVPQYVNALGLVLLALILILAARRLRGRTAYADAFLPLVLLHWEHAESFAWGFQIGLVFLSLLVAIVLWLLAPARPPDRFRLLAIGIAALLLPLLGGSLGIVYAAPILVWLGFMGLGRPAASQRMNAWIPAGLLALLTAVYWVGYERPPYLWLFTALFAIVAFAACALWLLRSLRSRPDDRARLLGFAAVGVSVVAAAIAIRGETGGVALRYGLLSSLVLVWVYLVALAIWNRTALRALHLCLFLLACLSFVPHMRVGYLWGANRHAESELFRAEADEGLSPEEIAVRHPSICPKQETMAAGLALLRARSLEPYGPSSGR